MVDHKIVRNIHRPLLILFYIFHLPSECNTTTNINIYIVNIILVEYTNKFVLLLKTNARVCTKKHNIQQHIEQMNISCHCILLLSHAEYTEPVPPHK